MQKIAVCMITTYFYPYRGGAEMQIERLSGWLSQHNIPVIVITRQLENTPTHEVYNGFEIYRIPQPPTPVLKEVAWMLVGAYYLLRHRNKWSIIHSHSNRAHSLGYFVTRLLRRPMLINLHRGGALGDLQRGLDRSRFGRITFNGAKKDPKIHFIAIDQPILDELHTHKVEESKIHFRVNGVDPNDFQPVDDASRRTLRQQLNLPVDQAIVTVVCRHVETKGLPNLIEAWKQVPNAHLVIVGTGPITEELKAKANAEVPGRVSFPGKVESVLPYLQASDIWTLPSLTEALPVSMLEAMACGLPIVATTVGGIPEVIQDGVSGFLVPPGEVQPLADALKRAVTLSPEIRAMGQAARQTVIDRYALDTVSATYADLYRQLVPRKNLSQ